MARQIIKQPDGLYCVFSTIVDNFILENATESDVYEFFINEAIEKEQEQLNQIFEKIRTHKFPYHNFTLSYAEAQELIKEIHGEQD